MTEATSSRTPRETAQLEFLLLCDLHRILGDSPTDANRHYVASVLDCLFELLPSRFEMEEQGGYLKEVTRKFPNWTDQVEALRMEHASLYEDLRQLRETLHDGTAYQTAGPRALQRTADWIEKMRQHEEEERRLTQVAANLEVGAGD